MARASCFKQIIAVTAFHGGSMRCSYRESRDSLQIPIRTFTLIQEASISGASVDTGFYAIIWLVVYLKTNDEGENE